MTSNANSHGLVGLFLAALSSHCCTLSYVWWVSQADVEYFVPAHELERVVSVALQKHDSICCAAESDFSSGPSTTTTSTNISQEAAPKWSSMWLGIVCCGVGVAGSRLAVWLFKRSCSFIWAQVSGLSQPTVRPELPQQAIAGEARRQLALLYPGKGHGLSW
jgi:hypothetical protein